MQNFESLNLCEKLLKAINLAGYEKPSPIQIQAIPELLQGRDLFACAQTGTGKTAAFALPIMDKLENSGGYPKPRQFRALILTPTRELAEQVASNINQYGKFTSLSCCKAYGGVSQKPQVRALSVGVDILVATPGRLLDLFRQKALSFEGVEFLVLDEADRMLDMGFIPDIRRICAQLPEERQSMLFSATLSEEIIELAQNIVKNPKRITISPDKPTVEKISQSLAAVAKDKKFDLVRHIMKTRLEGDESARALIFCRTKHGASKLAKKLTREGMKAEAIHGDKSQGARQNALNRFKRGECSALAATDIAARGIDIKDMSLVINYDLPEEVETYVHRIGRTARAEASGEAISFCSPEEVAELKFIERYIKREIPFFEDNPFESTEAKERVEFARKGGKVFSQKRRGRGGNTPNSTSGAGKDKKPNKAGDGKKTSSFKKTFNKKSPDSPKQEKPESGSTLWKTRRPPNAISTSKDAKNDSSHAQKASQLARGKSGKSSSGKSQKGSFWQKMKSKFKRS